MTGTIARHTKRKRAHSSHTIKGRAVVAGIPIEGHYRYEHHGDDQHVNHPDHILDPTHPTNATVSTKKHMSKKKKSQIKFQKKVQKAIQAPLPSNTWLEVLSSSGTGPDLIQNGSGTADLQNQIVSGSKNIYMLNPGSLWLSTATNTPRLYPWGPLSLLQSDNSYQLKATTGMARLRTKVARAEYVVTNELSDIQYCTIYSFVAAADISDSAYKDPITSLVTLQAAHLPLTTAGYTALPTIVLTSMTPLDIPGLGKWWKQETKTEALIPANGEFKFSFPKPRRPGFSYAEPDGKWAIKHKTQALLMTFRTGLSAYLTVGTNIAIIGTKTYHYQWLSGEQPNNAMRPVGTKIIM